MSPTSESQKRATAKWNAEHLITVGCSLKKEVAEAFKAKCAANSTTANTVLKNLIEQYIADNK